MKRKIHRRDFLKQSLTWSAVSLPILSCSPGFKVLERPTHELNSLTGPDGFDNFAALTDAQRSNVLFISVDDLNDWIEPLGGYPGIRTPHLSRLARMGLTFSRAYCSAPACGPSRASALTGVAPTTSQMYDFSNFRNNARLSWATTLPQFFRNNGYKTMGAGKIFHGDYTYEINGNVGPWQWDPVNQDNGAWVEFQNLPAEPRAQNGRANGITSYDSRDQMDWGKMTIADNALPDGKITDWAVQRLSQAHSQPFFMGVGFYRPHLPWYVPGKYFDMYPLNSIQLPNIRTNDLDDVPYWGQQLAYENSDHQRITGAGKWKEAVQGYCASISYADACLGRLLDALAQGPHAQKTTVVFWSDNGFHLGEKLGWRKFKMWERANRVPLIIRPPNYNLGGRTCSRVVSLLDLYPTLTDMCLNDIPGDLDGNSLVPLLESPERDWCYGAVSSWSDGGQTHHSVRTEKFRYIRYQDGGEELYDHQSDPNEWVNLLADANGQKANYQEVRKVLAALLPV